MKNILTTNIKYMTTISETKRILYQKKYDELKKQNDNNDKHGWNHPCYVELKYNTDEINSFIENPIDVQEGIFTCNKCSSKRTYSYSKQTRSSDEPLSVFVTCAQCEHKWREA
jgi:DNA-directed RNA polymerase subunit M/transcription elongation factor TFIIS